MDFASCGDAQQPRHNTTMSNSVQSNSLHLHLSPNLADRWGTAGDFAISFLQSPWFSAFRSMVFHSTPVHSLMSSHRFLCLPLRLPPCTVRCKTAKLRMCVLNQGNGRLTVDSCVSNVFPSCSMSSSVPSESLGPVQQVCFLFAYCSCSIQSSCVGQVCSDIRTLCHTKY